MWSLVSEIESYIKALLRQDSRGWIEISRKDLAEHFECVPSQITYVVNTRFTLQQGYCVESRRGGCGYIRICRLGAAPRTEEQKAGKQPQRTGAGRQPGLENSLDGMMADFHTVLFNLAQRGILTDRELTLLGAVFRALDIDASGEEVEALRFRILREILSSGDLFKA